MVETVTGTNRSAGVSYNEVLDRDSHPVRDILRVDNPLPPGPTLVDPILHRQPARPKRGHLQGREVLATLEAAHGLLEVVEPLIREQQGATELFVCPRDDLRGLRVPGSIELLLRKFEGGIDIASCER